MKLWFSCCLILGATFVSADYQNYKEYIEALAELEQRYKNVDTTIDLSGHTMRKVVKILHDILQTRAHTEIGTSQEDSHPALLKVNGVVYELYFQGTESQPGNCRLKQQGKKGKPWLKEKDGEVVYNSELNTEENYVEQNLLFCLEIARRKLCMDDNEDNYTKKTKEFKSINGTLVGCSACKYNDGNHVRCDSRGKGIKCSETAKPFVKNEDKNKYVKYDDHYDVAILDVIVIGLNLVNNRNECSTFSFFGCFDSKGRKNIADTFIKKADLDDRTLGKLKLEFYNKQIDDRDVIARGCEQYFKNDLSSWVNNQKVVDKLRTQNFTHWEPIGNLTTEVLDTTNLKKNPESVIAGIKECPSLAFESSDKGDIDSIYKKFLQTINNILGTDSPVYILDGNATKNYVKFLAPKDIKRKTKFAEKKIKKDDVDSVESLSKNHFEKGFVFLHAKGKDGINRWFYLNKSNGTMYGLGENSTSSL